MMNISLDNPLNSQTKDTVKAQTDVSTVRVPRTQYMNWALVILWEEDRNCEWTSNWCTIIAPNETPLRRD
ncbi:hypothetical protein NDU88_002985 [Pleurodeles waltl]|uniref:Uncharacterized protein n=1 Tax=Pleurodeles waltl TaxID=8319 RepID=A0AAV7LDX4_PLEWA|nr:hypothetical protein NDU88_002985 [Pleurodeles waltl]